MTILLGENSGTGSPVHHVPQFPVIGYGLERLRAGRYVLQPAHKRSKITRPLGPEETVFLWNRLSRSLLWRQLPILS